jgi:hypothetical protein
MDLINDLIHPWSVALLLAVVEGDKNQQRRLASVARYMPGGPTDARKSFLRSRSASLARALRSLPEIAWLALRQRKAMSDMDSLSRSARLPGLKSVILGISQTLPGFLSNAWLALLSHPEAMRRLYEEPDLIPAATEELMRYAGFVHTLVRHAPVDVRVAGADVQAKQHVILKVASANRDPTCFHQPDRLIIDRRVDRSEISHLTLGAGPHSCVGAQFVRSAAVAATRAFVERIAMIGVTGKIEWSRGAVSSFPTTLPVVIGLRKRALR